VAFYLSGYNFDATKKSGFQFYNEGYIKYFSFLRNQQSITSAQQGWTDPIKIACKEFEVVAATLKNEFIRMLKKGVFFNEVYTKEIGCLETIKLFLENYSKACQNESENQTKE
jgi:hypothetical protein